MATVQRQHRAGDLQQQIQAAVNVIHTFCKKKPTIGIILGVSSAGQRRNEHQKRSWAGFFLGAFVLSLTIITFVGFWQLKLQVH